MSRRPIQAGASPGVLKRALVLIGAARAALADPARWSEGAWAQDETGESLGASIWVAARSPRAYSRELLAEFVHQAWEHGYVVQVDAPRNMLRGFHRAPASVWAASEALADACLAAFPPCDRHGVRLDGLRQLIREKPLPERVVLALSELNEVGRHADILQALDQAQRTLQAELDRHTARTSRRRAR